MKIYGRPKRKIENLTEKNTIQKEMIANLKIERNEWKEQVFDLELKFRKLKDQYNRTYKQLRQALPKPHNEVSWIEWKEEQEKLMKQKETHLKKFMIEWVGYETTLEFYEAYEKYTEKKPISEVRI
tara:strand:+ start:106 stop:483 length:378 start_codon:yes stop_codon:yes gene_type:complete